MKARPSGRAPDELRPVRITRRFTRHAEGSVLVEFGDTRVLCTASGEEGVPAFLRNTGRVLTRGQLIDRVWGADYVGDTKTLDVHVKRLRAKVEPDPANPRFLVTVRGLGYKYES